jgi:hypothetical protein
MAMQDLRRLEVRVLQLGQGRVSQRLVFEGTNVDVGSHVHALHRQLAAVGYMVKVRYEYLDEAAALGHPMYGVVRAVTADYVEVEQLQTSPADAVPGPMFKFTRDFFLSHYEVD